jgi:hypothetical protein
VRRARKATTTTPERKGQIIKKAESQDESKAIQGGESRYEEILRGQN